MSVEVAIRRCEFCGQTVANRGEAYYDHLQTNAACGEAWKSWTESLQEDRAGG